MKVGDLVTLKPESTMYRVFQNVGTEKVGVVTEVCGTSTVYVRFDGVGDDLVSLTIMLATWVLDIVSEAQK